jgi:hypothetical protein
MNLNRPTADRIHYFQETAIGGGSDHSQDVKYVAEVQGKCSFMLGLLCDNSPNIGKRHVMEVVKKAV